MCSVNSSPISDLISPMKRENEDLDRKLKKCMMENSILNKQLQQWKREHGELLLSHRDTENRLTESLHESNCLRLEIKRLRIQRDEDELKLRNSNKEVEI